MPPSIGKGLVLVMATACGICASNMYSNQPLLAILELAFAGQRTLVDCVPTVTQLGFAAGLIFLVPLGDRLERRRLILLQFAAMSISLALLALAPCASVLVIASALVGITASVAQQIVPFAAELAGPKQRGSFVGTVMSGLLCGILFGRALGGYIGEHFGWRVTFWCGMALSVAMCGMLAIMLPRLPPKTTERYMTLMRSLGSLFIQEPALRRATAIQAMLFGSFIALWTILALRLETHFQLGAQVAGAFGIVGAVGVLIAPLAGRIADRRGPRAVIGLGAFVMLLSWMVFAGWTSLPGMIVGVILLDFGEQSALVCNQHVIYGLRPEARSRVNTIFMGGMFIGGSVGSWFAGTAWRAHGWAAVAGLGAIMVVLGLGIHAWDHVARAKSRHVN
ncbi:MFS transporter [Burkholderia cepacia]|nr:MFS transporter [Burkholderia cepacia]KVB59698.1 MFS transporter [Burkholderia cepacia]KVC03215.1 MFS transporter [Burkholderia cepacia]